MDSGLVFLLEKRVIIFCQVFGFRTSTWQQTATVRTGGPQVVKLRLTLFVS